MERLFILFVLVLSLLAATPAFAVDPCNCKGYAGPGGPCYAGPGGGAYAGPGGPAYERNHFSGSKWTLIHVFGRNPVKWSSI